MSNPIAVETVDKILVVRFVRPEIRNPLSLDVIELLDSIIEQAINSSGVEKLVLTGTDGVFASGADLREIANINAETAKEFSRHGQRLMNKIAESAKCTVAAINGFCFGGGLDLALSCHQRIAASTATFCHPGAGLGIITGWSGTQRLPRLIGQADALRMFFTAEPVNAAEALRIGLIDRIAEDPLAEVLANKRADLSS
ncbi:MAG: enoyl-CoA hydratase/isomerase family protein [Pyrinomonadaceae bacterium]